MWVILWVVGVYFSIPLLRDANQMLPFKSSHIAIISLLYPNSFSFINPCFFVHVQIAVLVPIHIFPDKSSCIEYILSFVMPSFSK